MRAHMRVQSKRYNGATRVNVLTNPPPPASALLDLSSPLASYSEYIGRDWVPKVKVIIFDFDKTITNKHTGGSVALPAYATDDYIAGNFADLDFFRVSVCL